MPLLVFFFPSFFFFFFFGGALSESNSSPNMTTYCSVFVKLNKIEVQINSMGCQWNRFIHHISKP